MCVGVGVCVCVCVWGAEYFNLFLSHSHNKMLVLPHILSMYFFMNMFIVAVYPVGD